MATTGSANVYSSCYQWVPSEKNIGETIVNRILFAFLVACTCLLGSSGIAFGQKGNNSKQDERRENERVANAERALADAKKDLSAIQKDLRSEAVSLEKSALALRQLKKKAREVREEVEDRLGAKVGIPDALTKVRQAGTALEEISAKLREQLHVSPNWIQAKEAADRAKVAKAALLDDVEQVGNDNDDKLRPLQHLISKPMELENEFIAKDSTGSEAMKRLSEQQAELDKKRKLLPIGEVEKDRKVVQALSDITKKEKEIDEIEGKLKKMKAEAGKIQKRFADAQMNLQKAKAADAADPNRPGKKKGR